MEVTTSAQTPDRDEGEIAVHHRRGVRVVVCCRHTLLDLLSYPFTGAHPSFWPAALFDVAIGQQPPHAHFTAKAGLDQALISSTIL